MNGTNRPAALLISVLLLCHCALTASVVHMAMSRSNLEVNVLRRDYYGSLFKRTTTAAELFNNITTTSGYLVNVEVGTPGQTLSLIIDTGSSDTFVLAETDDQCNNQNIIYEYGPCIGGTFDKSSSSTFTTVAVGGFKIKYADGSISSGDYISDNLKISGSLISGLQMGLAFHSTVGVGIMGIGYQADESVKAKNLYPNIIDQLVAQKFINLRAYSLYLDDKETSTGSILFGGIDTAKFIGTLKILPVQNNPQTNSINIFIILMTSLSITDRSETPTWTSSTLSLPVVLDSGTTLTYLPSSLVDEIISQLGAVDDTENSGLIFVDCDWRVTRANDSLSFSFGDSNGPVIHVPLSEVIRTIPEGYDYNPPFTNTCDLGLRGADLSIYLLGDTFLRSAYVVYDLDHNQIALAQTNFEAPGSQVHEIPAGASGIPLLSGQASGLTQVPASHFTSIIAPAASQTQTLPPLATTDATAATFSPPSSSARASSSSATTSKVADTTATAEPTLVMTSAATSTSESTVSTATPQQSTSMTTTSTTSAAARSTSVQIAASSSSSSTTAHPTTTTTMPSPTRSLAASATSSSAAAPRPQPALRTAQGMIIMIIIIVITTSLSTTFAK